MADPIRPAHRVGSWVVHGDYYTGIVHAEEVLEYGPVRI